MRTVFGSWKYIFKNIWLLLPFVIVPAIFLALSVDYTGVSALTKKFFSGQPEMEFVQFFKCWSIVRFDSWLGGVYSLLAYLSVALFASFLLAFVEKHMRIGKRTFSGVFAECRNILPSVLFITLAYTVLYEVWAVVFSAILFVISFIHVTAVVYIATVACCLFFSYVLFFLITIFYLWTPCRQATGFGAYDAFLYSYRLTVGVRWKLILSYLISYLPAIAAIAGASLLPSVFFRIIVVLVYAMLILNFCVRMETVYFETDKIDREDVLHSYRGYLL